MPHKTESEVQAEIKALEACKSYAPNFSMFGDDNHATIDLQIEYLRGNIDTTEDEFYVVYDDDDQSAILEAESWLEGDEPVSPSADWDNWKPKQQVTEKKQRKKKA